MFCAVIFFSWIVFEFGSRGDSRIARDNFNHNDTQCQFMQSMIAIHFVKTQYLDEEQGKKNPTDRSVLVVRDCSWDLYL